MVNIAGADKAKVIQALYAASRPMGPSPLGYQIGELPYEHAALLVGVNIDYIHGRVMKVKVDGDAFDPKDYDAANGDGAAERAVDGLRTVKSFPSFWYPNVPA